MMRLSLEYETEGIGGVERGNEECEGGVVLKKIGDRIVSPWYMYICIHTPLINYIHILGV